MEVCYNNSWGTICGDSGWNYNATKVVCNQLGFNSELYLKSHAVISFVSGHTHILLHSPLHCTDGSFVEPFQYIAGTGPILLSGLSCTGNESTLFNCSRGNSVIGITGCNHNQDASVHCAGMLVCKGMMVKALDVRMVVWELYIRIRICVRQVAALYY